MQHLICIFCILPLLTLCRCDDGETYGPMGYAAQILVEVDGAYRDDFCANGVTGGTYGGVSITFFRGSREGFDLEWRGRDGILELLVEDNLEDDAVGVVLFHETFDQSFGASRQVRRLATEFEGHDVLIYVEGLDQDRHCLTAKHQQSDYSTQGTDDGIHQPAHLLNVPWLLDLHGAGPDEVWAVGFGGVVLHFDGAGWTQSVDNSSVDLIHVWASSPGGDLYVVERTGSAETEQRSLLRGRPGSWQEVDLGTLEGELVDRPWGVSLNDIWVTGHKEEEGSLYGVVHHFDGVAWTIPASGIGGHLDGVWGSGPDDIFVAGNDGTGYGGYIAHFADGEFDRYEYPESWIGGIWGSGPDDVWAVGAELLHYDGSKWTEVEKPPVVYMFRSVWGSGPNDVWVVGSQGTKRTGVSGVILHWDGAFWTEATVTPINELNSIWGSGSDDVWAMGSGTIYHYDGIEWKQTSASEIAVSE